jgi:hypothetical protein
MVPGYRAVRAIQKAGELADTDLVVALSESANGCFRDIRIEQLVQRESQRERDELAKRETELLDASTAFEKARALSRKAEQRLHELGESLLKRLAQQRSAENGQSEGHLALLRSLEESFKGFSERARALKMDQEIIRHLQCIEMNLREGSRGP